MTEIVIRRCLLRVVRGGGWSWGPDSRRLVDELVETVPEQIARSLADVLGGAPPDGDDAPDVEIAEPLVVNVSLRGDALAGLSGGALGDASVKAPTGAFLPQLEDSLDRGVRAAVEPWLQPSSIPSAGLPGIQGQTAPEPGRLTKEPVVALATFLAHEHERGRLGELLDLLGLSTLELWHRALSTGERQRSPLVGMAIHYDAPSLVPPALEEQGLQRDRLRALRQSVAALVDQADVLDPLLAGGSTPDGDTLDSRRVPSAGEGLDAPGSVVDPITPSSGDSEIDLPGNSVLPPALTDPGEASPFLASSEAELGRVSTTLDAAGKPLASLGVSGQRLEPTPILKGDVYVDSALPFLLLGPLSTMGYLEALAPVFEPQGMQDQAALFATALAYKALAPLERGWRRKPGDADIAAAFAGLDVPVPEPALVHFAQQARPALPALDAILGLSLARGHTEGQGLLLYRADPEAGGGLILADLDGLLPMAWTDNLDDVLSLWRTCGRPPMMVGADAAEPTTLEDLEASGVPFVTDVPPARHDRWTRLPHPLRLWANPSGVPLHQLARQAGPLAEAASYLPDVVRALAVERRAVPLADDATLERSLTLAAAAALGLIAYTLWSEREPTDPLLALARFADLSAHVHFDAEKVRVRLPLGPRHADLLRHGLLRDLSDIPWLQGRVLEFSGG